MLLFSRLKIENPCRMDVEFLCPDLVEDWFREPVQKGGGGLFVIHDSVAISPEFG